MAYHKLEQAVDYYVHDPNKRSVGLKIPQMTRFDSGTFMIYIGKKGWSKASLLAEDPGVELVIDSTGTSHSLRGTVTVNVGDLQEFIKHWRPMQTRLFSAVQGAV
jgi:hypothetical protein